METGDWLPAQVQVLRNDLDVALATLAEIRQRLDGLVGALDSLTSGLLAERQGRAGPGETDALLSTLRDSLRDSLRVT